VVALPVKVMLAFAVIAASLPFVGLHLSDSLNSMLAQTLRGLGG
jgi:hypothetical protein